MHWPSGTAPNSSWMMENIQQEPLSRYLVLDDPHVTLPVGVSDKPTVKAFCLFLHCLRENSVSDSVQSICRNEQHEGIL